MAIGRELLNQQLAEVAAGRRKSVDDALRSSVEYQEQRAAREAAEHRANMEAMAKAGARAAEDSARLQREDARLQQHAVHLQEQHLEAQREAVRLAEQTSDSQERHNEEIASIERQRLGALQSANYDMLRMAWREQGANAEHRERLESIEQEKLQLTKSAHRSDALQSSLCFASATTLAELLELEQACKEHDEYLAFLLQALPLAHEFEKEVQRSDSDFLEAEMKARQQGLESAQLAKDEAAFLANELETVRSAIAAAAAAAEPKRAGGLSWFSRKPKVDETQPAVLISRANELEVSIGVAKERFGVLKQEAAQLEPARLRAERIKQLYRSSSVAEHVEMLMKGYAEWLQAEPRCEQLAAMHLQVPMIQRGKVDLAVCIALDQARLAGVSEIDYPDLGRLPFGTELAEAALRIAELRARGELFPKEPKGSRELTWLQIAESHGEFDLTKEPSFVHLFADAPEEAAQTDDPLYDRAVHLLAGRKDVSISFLQRQLRIGYNHAARLLEQMENAGEVSAMSTSGTRQVLTYGA